MSDKISAFLGDIIRWGIALILLHIAVWILFLFFMYPFEWILSKTTDWKFIFHLLFWFMLGGGIVATTTMFGGMISVLSMFLVRQHNAYNILFSVAIFALVIFCIYGAWSSNVEFSWELLRYSTFNRILFTIMILQLLQIPSVMMEGSSN